MNSLTPVTSLARSSAEMVAGVSANDPGLKDLREATETVARRAEGILRFVESYREFAQSPEVRRQSFSARKWAEELLQLALMGTANPKMDASVEVVPKALRLSADPELLAQAALNLIRNAFRAVADKDDPVVRLSLRRLPSGQCMIEVRDNGPGIPEDRRDDVFLPFYTTHHGGSGVGLSFARQVALAHGGSIDATVAPEGGASIRMTV